MRFVLDHNVDAQLAVELRAAGHQAVTAANIGFQDAGDPAIAVWAADKDFIVVSHDMRFAAWRKRQTWGRHVYLKCSEPAAIRVMRRWLHDISTTVQHRPDFVITLQLDRMEVAPLSWQDPEADW